MSDGINTSTAPAGGTAALGAAVLGKDARKFLERVVPWPEDPEGGPGYVNLHYMQKTKDGARTFLCGKPFKTVQGMVAGIAAKIQDKSVTDIYFCTTLQRKAKQMKGGWLSAERSSESAIAAKALWIDIDVKPGELEKGHATFEDAVRAIAAFIKKYNLPKPSMMVKSGGGLHVYWVTTRPMPIDEWRDLAQRLKTLLLKSGLKCDAHITADAARILRPPETFNYKQDPKRPVELFYDKGPDYDPEVLKTALAGYNPDRTPTVAAATQDFGLAALAGLTPSPRLADFVMEVGDEGIERDPIKLDTKSVMKGCPFMREALKTGGKEFTEPQWDLSVLASVFLPEGRDLAHKMSKGHAEYDPASTDEKFDRKEAWVQEKDGGWPTCHAIKSAGCEDCATCPHFGKIKSPLNLGLLSASAPAAGHSGTQAKVVQSPIEYFPGNEATCRTELDNVVAADPYTFTMGDRLVILRLPNQTVATFERWSGDLPGTTPALPADIIERAETLTWMTPVGGRGEPRNKRSKPPRDFCTDYLTQRRGRYAARPLVGISRVPFMRDDGSIRHEPGYDPQTGIFLDRPPNLTIPDTPTLEDAKAAFERVMKPFEHYTFEDEKTGPLLAFAANVTALERPYMRTAPMFVINGAQAGTGKGQMCLAIGNLALGTAPPFMAWGHDDDEFKKRLDTMLLASPAMLVMDNCNGRLLRGDTLEMILTEGRATLRPLGKSEAVAVSNRTFFMANGNNLQISGDMSRRSLKIGILPGSANPERETFPFTPAEYVIEKRDALLSDYYTIMRAYRLAGMPRSGLPAVGSFSEWERKVRDIVYWLTGYDLSKEFDKNKGDDPLRQNDAAMLAALNACFGENWFKPSEVEEALKQATEWRRFVEPENRPHLENDKTRAKIALLEAVEQVFGSKPVNAKSLGYWAKGLENAFIDGFVLRRRIDQHTKSNQLRIEVKNE